MKCKIFFLIATILISACTTTTKLNTTSVVASPSKPMSFDFLDNRMFVNVMINGKGPFKFVFDTGGSNCMTPEVAKILELPMSSIEDATGAGEQSAKAWNVLVNTFEVGDIKLVSQEFMVIDFSAIKRTFALPAFDGVFGYEFLQKFSASIDFVGKKISFLPNGFTKADGFTAIPFKIVGDKPVISAKINGVDAKVLIDTGDRSALTIFSNFKKNRAVKHAFDGRKAEVTGYGIGGPIPAILSKIDSIEIAQEAKIKNVVSRSPVTQGGFNAIPNVNASIGNEILRQFDVIFDYKNQMIYFKPNKFYGEITRFTPVPVL